MTEKVVVRSKGELAEQLKGIGMPPEKIKAAISSIPDGFIGNMSVVQSPSGMAIKITGVGMTSKPEQPEAQKPDNGTYLGSWKLPGPLAGIAEFFGISRKKEESKEPPEGIETIDFSSLLENLQRESRAHLKTIHIMRMRQLKEEAIEMFESCMNQPMPELIIWFGNPYDDDAPVPVLFGDGYDPPGHLSVERMQEIMHYLRSRFAYLYLDGRPVLIHISGDPNENARIFEELTPDCSLNMLGGLGSILNSPVGCSGCLEKRLDQADDPDGPLPFSPKLLILNGAGFGVFGDDIGPEDDSLTHRLIMEELKRVADDQCNMKEMTNGGRIINFGPGDHQVQMPKEMSDKFCEGCPGCEKVREFGLEALKALHPIVFCEKILGIEVPDYIKDDMFETSEDDGPDSGVDLAGEDEEPLEGEPAEEHYPCIDCTGMDVEGACDNCPIPLDPCITCTGMDVELACDHCDLSGSEHDTPADGDPATDQTIDDY